MTLGLKMRHKIKTTQHQGKANEAAQLDPLLSSSYMLRSPVATGMMPIAIPTTSDLASAVAIHAPKPMSVRRQMI
jgi:hypothetical protein